MSFIKQPFQLAPEDNTVIYALGEKGTNVFFCQLQAAGPEKASKQELRDTARLFQDAPALLKTLAIMTELTALKYGNLDADVFSEIEKARALIAKHKGE